MSRSLSSRAAHNGKLHEAARRGELRVVEKLMIENSAVLDGRAYAIAVNAYADAGDLQNALRWLRAGAQRGGHYVPQVEACTAAVKAACVVGKCQLAKNLLETMANQKSFDDEIPAIVSEHAKPNARTIATFLRGCLQNGWFESISWILRRATSWQIALDIPVLSYAAITLAAALKPIQASALDCQSAQAYIAIAQAHAVLAQAELFQTARAKAFELLGQEEEQNEFISKPNNNIHQNRTASNVAFRKHRAKEIKALLQALKPVRSVEFTVNHLRRSFVIEENNILRPALRLGLAEAEFTWARESSVLNNASRTERKRISRAARTALELRESFFTASLSDLPRRYCFPHFVANKTSIMCELGAGDGEFATRRAQNNQNDCWLINELKFNRAAAIVARCVLTQLTNTATIAGRADAFLKALPDESLDGCFVNFPQPPTQVCITTEPQLYDGRHMLDLPLFSELARVLKPSAAITIATDNASYVDLLVAIAKLVNAKSSSISLLPSDNQSFVTVHMPQTTEENTYFDRLWQTGCSQHAQARRRFLIRLYKQQIEERKKKRRRIIVRKCDEENASQLITTTPTTHRLLSSPSPEESSSARSEPLSNKKEGKKKRKKKKKARDGRYTE